MVSWHFAALRRGLSMVGARPYYALAHSLREPRRARIREELMRSQFLSYEELCALQERRLRRLLAYAREASPWYRQRLGQTPHHTCSPLDDLRQLPILEKEDLQLHLDEITGPPLDDWFKESTSGSTGHPSRVFHTPQQADAINADLERDYTMCAGYRLHHRRAYLWGGPNDRGGQVFIRDVLMSRLRLSGVAMDRTAETTTAQLRAFAPRLLIGYATMLRELALELDRPIRSLRAIQSSAETLTEDDRALIEEGIGAPVYNRYGAREVGNLAHECDEHGGLHLLMENNLVEIVDADGNPLTEPGAEGDVVVTSLTNWGTPLIRYRLGDMARVGERSCRCGRGSSKLDAVIGRTAEVIVSPSGKRFMGPFFNRAFFSTAVRQFRVEQLTSTDLRIDVVPAAGYTDAVRERLVRTIAEDGDRAFVVEWRLAAEIERTSAGKFLFVTSRLGKNRSAALNDFPAEPL